MGKNYGIADKKGIAQTINKLFNVVGGKLLMKIINSFVLLGLIILLSTSCSIQGQKPDGGFWYCEELKTGIDFDLYQTTTQCVKVYHDDGNIQTNGCHTDYGVGICFFTGSVSNNTYNEYFHGTFRYNKEKEQFIIESYPDGIIYIFVKQ